METCPAGLILVGVEIIHDDCCVSAMGNGSVQTFEVYGRAGHDPNLRRLSTQLYYGTDCWWGHGFRHDQLLPATDVGTHPIWSYKIIGYTISTRSQSANVI